MTDQCCGRCDNAVALNCGELLCCSLNGQPNGAPELDAFIRVDFGAGKRCEEYRALEG